MTGFLSFVALAPLSVLLAVVTNAIWLVPVVILGGEFLVFLHQRHIGVVIDESRKTLVVQNFFIRYEIPFTSIERVGPGAQRWGTPAHNAPVTQRGNPGSCLNVVYRGPDGKERIVAPMNSSASFFRQPKPSALIEGLASLCQRRNIPCDLSDFGVSPTPAAAPESAASSPVEESTAAAGRPRSSSLFYVNGRGVKRNFAIGSIVLFVAGFASTAVVQSGWIFLAGVLGAIALQAAGRQ